MSSEVEGIILSIPQMRQGAQRLSGSPKVMGLMRGEHGAPSGSSLFLFPRYFSDSTGLPHLTQSTPPLHSHLHTMMICNRAKN